MTTETARPEAVGFDPRYVIVAGACLTQFVVIGLLFAYAVLFKEFEDEFGWSRAFLSGCSSMAFFLMGVLAMVNGRLNDRYGPRIVLCVSGLLYGVGFAAISLVSEPWHLVAIFALFISVGMSTHDVVTLSTVARWFERRRGMMTGVVKVGTAAGQVAIPPLAALLIALIDWRAAVALLGFVAMALLLAAALMMKKPPTAQNADGETIEQPGLTFSEARRTRPYWTIAGIQLLFLPALMSIPIHIVVHGVDMGMSAALAATLLSVSGASSVVGRLTIGVFSDRIGGRNAYIVCFIPFVASLVSLIFIDEPAMLFAAIVFYGFAHGGFFTVVSPTVAEYFGFRAHGAIFGSVLFVGSIGGAAGPIMAGWIFDVYGSYDYAFATLALFGVIGLSLALSLPSAQRAGAAAE